MIDAIVNPFIEFSFMRRALAGKDTEARVDLGFEIVLRESA